ncbi:tRNA (adenosine(37)-N6)-threonylcarbamoyltransferase complex dimerization subunit type 1 TsaB [Thermosulfuriphilus ammonigenes]|uniref:tRNA (Adenosine(37)-N6)-threonylcarbamoyltransferase complex dimerization subunit type 1 TsaB n=1 Tax=Thermosulfuriphilus ammonigenes TaxID=1936021 RepID=A0A6G7PX02_9BACT|nr:tRNA (adenosine(37)-N6)-threonylcarbamoyltransferase complex dimerization subunit type 1 TsaB [Thermosulfuriphilus ammonigenes]MBA2849685.1 tRNA threonylcarbamoyladenosine biosynthesis protein TsaB [Thermosulfuriphilus ammonigenes]QIJ72219.1 tRNA (adenosine(37)-N6)-threonylcarbamoyltransferase complex dimerization subunit type 1 TsaB [Thermosulfuriphilus ammonigenes]
MGNELILALETSGLFGGVALLEGEKILGELVLAGPETHSRRLLWAAQILLQRQARKIEDITTVAVSLGPGSFTGLRIGLATAKGLAYALKCNILGIPTLDALASHLPEVQGIVCPLLDAKKSQVYAALYRRGHRISDYLAISPQELAERLLSFRERIYLLGPGLEIYKSFFKEALKKKIVLAPPHLSHVRPGTIGILASYRLAHQDIDDLREIRPLYIRPSEAEINLGRTLIQTTTLPTEA